MVKTSSNINLFDTYDSDQGGGKRHGIGEVNYCRGNSNQEIYQTALNFVGYKKWSYLITVDFDENRNF